MSKEKRTTAAKAREISYQSCGIGNVVLHNGRDWHIYFDTEFMIWRYDDDRPYLDIDLTYKLWLPKQDEIAAFGEVISITLEHLGEDDF